MTIKKRILMIFTVIICIVLLAWFLYNTDKNFKKLITGQDESIEQTQELVELENELDKTLILITSCENEMIYVKDRIVQLENSKLETDANIETINGELELLKTSLETLELNYNSLLVNYETLNETIETIQTSIKNYNKLVYATIQPSALKNLPDATLSKMLFLKITISSSVTISGVTTSIKDGTQTESQFTRRLTSSDVIYMHFDYMDKSYLYFSAGEYSMTVSRTNGSIQLSYKTFNYGADGLSFTHAVGTLANPSTQYCNFMRYYFA